MDFLREYHNWLVSNAPSTKEEKLAAAEFIAEKLNKGRGPTAMVIPLRGRGVHAGFDDPKDWDAISEVLKTNLKPEIKVVELDATINDRAFSDPVLELLDEMMQ